MDKSETCRPEARHRRRNKADGDMGRPALPSHLTRMIRRGSLRNSGENALVLCFEKSGWERGEECWTAGGGYRMPFRAERGNNSVSLRKRDIFPWRGLLTGT